MKFQNVEYSESILFEKNPEHHLKILEIVSKNIKDFKKRSSNLDSLKFKYCKTESQFSDSPTYKFERIKKPGSYKDEADHYFSPNSITHLYYSEESFETLVNRFCEKCYSNFYKRTLETGNRDKEVEIFVKLFKNYYPKGDFLNAEQIKYFKDSINAKCHLILSYS